MKIFSNLLFWAFLCIGFYLLFLIFKKIRDSKKESVQLLNKLNYGSLPATVVVDNFAAEHNIVCTYSLDPAPSLSAYSHYLTVTLGDNQYNYFLKGKKWILP